MDRVSHNSSSKFPDADRTGPPNPNSNSPKTTSELIAFIAGADKEAIEEFTQKYFPILENAGADALTSFFYIVKNCFDHAETSKKSALFVLLSDFACKAEGKIPDESRLQIIAHLSTMPFIGTDDIREMMTIAESVISLMKKLLNELNFLTQNPLPMNQSSNEESYCSRLADTLHKLNTVHTLIIENVNGLIRAPKDISTF